MPAETIKYLCDYAGVPCPEDPNSEFAEYLGVALIKALGLPGHVRKFEIVIEERKDPVVRCEYFLLPGDSKNRELVEICELFELKLKTDAADTAPARRDFHAIRAD